MIVMDLDALAERFQCLGKDPSAERAVDEEDPGSGSRRDCGPDGSRAWSTEIP